MKTYYKRVDAFIDQATRVQGEILAARGMSINKIHKKKHGRLHRETLMLSVAHIILGRRGIKTELDFPLEESGEYVRKYYKMITRLGLSRVYRNCLKHLGIEADLLTDSPGQLSEQTETSGDGKQDKDIRKLIIADPRPLVRAGFRSILKSCNTVKILDEIQTPAELFESEYTKRADLLLLYAERASKQMTGITERLIRDIPRLPILIYTESRELDDCRQFIGRGVRGYILSSDPFDVFIHSVLYTGRDNYHISPTIAPIYYKTPESGYIHELAESLTKREREVVSMVSEGLGTMDIAERLNVKPNTINKHRENIRSKIHRKDWSQVLTFFRQLNSAHTYE